MKRRESGQALALVLVLMAVGALMITPSLNLSYTTQLTSETVREKTKTIYALDAGHEYAMWKLLHDEVWRGNLVEGVLTPITPLDVCGIEVTVSVAMQAVPGQGGISLALNTAVIKPTKVVTPTAPATPGTPELYTFTIELEQMTDDLTPMMDAVFDVLPAGFKKATTVYVLGSSEISTDGINWTTVPDPLVEEPAATRVRLKWPADYVPEDPPDWDDPENPTITPATGGFSSDPGDTDHYFAGIRDFLMARQKKWLRFQVWEDLPSTDTVQCNWVVLRPWGTVSGPQAPITTGAAVVADGCENDGLLVVTKLSEPEMIQPGIATAIKYTMSITNKESASTTQVNQVTDYLPPGFVWLGGDAGGSDGWTEGTVEWVYPGTAADGVTITYDADLERYVVVWTFQPDIAVQAGATETLVFWALASSEVSGAYHNEVTALPTFGQSLPSGFDNPAITTLELLYTSYSWETGTVMVPTYDANAGTNGDDTDTNLSLIPGSITITSFQVR